MDESFLGEATDSRLCILITTGIIQSNPPASVFSKSVWCPTLGEESTSLLPCGKL